MQIKFNHKVYEKNKSVKADDGNGLGRLCFDIFKYYLDININKTYQELQKIFNTSSIHKNFSSSKSTKSVIFNELDFKDWYDNHSSEDSKRDDRYFGFGGYSEPIEYNGEKLYFTTQWGNTNIPNMINFAKQNNFNIEVIEDLSEMNKNIVKNIILYGSPGVGKTHNTNKLIRLIEDGKSDREIFETIKANENSETIDISDIKERVKFVTFHQSFGYEDFIEGFRPNEEGNIGLEKGIFLEICNDAEENLLKSSEERKIPFKEAFNRLFKEKIENEESVKIDLKRTGSYFKVNDFNDKTIYFEKQSGTTKHTLSMTSLEKMYDVEKNDFINGGLAVYYEPILEKLLKIKRESHVEKIERKNYYLVIDEINRGNISKIFGELITLIEEDKRDTLEVTLPYSKKPFKIPSNLYIIGTMNSTDKSIALIDIALRRRFTFLKMNPKADLINYQKARQIFEVVNKKITETLGEDYQIGHSYCMKIQNDDDLAFVLEYKIIPLLEEYYYGDDRLTEVIALCKQDTILDNNEQ